MPQAAIGQVFQLPNGEVGQVLPCGSGSAIPGGARVGNATQNQTQNDVNGESANDNDTDEAAEAAARKGISKENNCPQASFGQVFRLPNGRLGQVLPLGSGIGIPGSSGVGKVDKGLGSENKIEVNRPTSRENYVKAACANVPAESERIKNDLLGESANNEEVVNDVANAAAREEEDLQMQPKDRKLSAVNCKENHQVMELNNSKI